MRISDWKMSCWWYYYKWSSWNEYSTRIESLKEDSSEVTSTPTQNDINCYFPINSFVVTAESWCPPPSAVGQPSQCDKPSPCKDSSGHLYIFEMISFPSVLLGVRECIQSFLEHSPIFYLDTEQWPGLIILTCTVISSCWLTLIIANNFNLIFTLFQDSLIPEVSNMGFPVQVNIFENIVK